MGIFAKGDIVLVSFPFTDLSNMKVRPALVIFSPPGNNSIVMQITSQSRGPYAISIAQGDLDQGTLRKQSFEQPDILATLDGSLIKAKLGSPKPRKMNEISTTLVGLLSS